MIGKTGRRTVNKMSFQPKYPLQTAFSHSTIQRFNYPTGPQARMAPKYNLS